MARCGAVRRGAVRRGAAQGGAGRRRAVRCGAVRCGAVRRGAARRGAVRAPGSCAIISGECMHVVWLHVPPLTLWRSCGEQSRWSLGGRRPPAW